MIESNDDLELDEWLKNLVLQREQEMKEFDLNVPPALDGLCWLISGGSSDFEPCACFSQFEYAALCNSYLQSHHVPLQIKLDDAKLLIDQFLPLLKDGKYPFYLVVTRELDIFDGLELASNLTDPIVWPFIAYNVKIDDYIDVEKRCVAGLFWDYHKTLAAEKAVQYARELMDFGVF